MIYPADYLHEVINTFLAALPYDRQPATLYQPIQYALAGGGKRLRPVLMLLTYNLFRDDIHSILYPAAGIETYHNFTLLHDDLMDKSPMRRGRPTVHTRWDDNTAILSGDNMLVLAYQYIAQCPADVLPDVLRVFTTTALQVDEGQQYDMDFERRHDVTEAEYIEMIRLKTSVLLAAAMQIGAILAHATTQQQEMLYKVGEALGIAFQLQDDYLDVYGDEAHFGKPIGQDICNNKQTYLLINALLRAKGSDYDTLLHWVTMPVFTPAEKISAVTALYDKLAINELVLEKIAYYFSQAHHYLSLVDIPSQRKTALIEFINSLNHRDI